VQSEAEACSLALKLLQNGDVRQAVYLLNKNKLTRLSLLVSQASRNQSAVQYLKDVQPQKDAHSDLLRFISGQAQQHGSWQHELLYNLMFKEPN
jgi:hypothetical protein